MIMNSFSKIGVHFAHRFMDFFRFVGSKKKYKRNFEMIKNDYEKVFEFLPNIMIILLYNWQAIEFHVKEIHLVKKFDATAFHVK